MEYIIVSACLLGLRTRYDGGSKPDVNLEKILEGRAPIPVCPEQLGGLPTPRPRAEISEGDGTDVLAGRSCLLNERGEDVTARYVRGAEEVAVLAKKFGVKTACLKAKSPACGVSAIKRKGKLAAGPGVAAAKLLQMGIKLIEVG